MIFKHIIKSDRLSLYEWEAALTPPFAGSPYRLNMLGKVQGFSSLSDAVRVAYRNTLKLDLSFETVLLITKLYKEHCNVGNT